MRQTMNINDFIKLREKDWQRLQSLVEKRRGRNTLTAAEVHELGRLYRAVASDLALARRDYPGQRVTLFLNQLLTRTHSFLYQEDVTDLGQLVRLFTHVIPQTFRRTWIFWLAAALLFLVPAVAGYRLAYSNPEVATPLGLAEQREMLASQELWTDIPLQERPYASAFIMSNNIRIAILAFGGGMAFGLFSVYVLTVNGLFLGAVLGLAAHYGVGQPLLEFVMGHGVIELSVIVMAGAAGLQLGYALLNPGIYSRRAALGLAARQVFVLVILALPLLVVAGLIEGFVSPSDAPFAVRLAVSLGSGGLLYGYLLLAGRAESKD